MVRIDRYPFSKWQSIQTVTELKYQYISEIQYANQKQSLQLREFWWKTKLFFGMGIFHTAYGLKVLRQAENQYAPDVPREQFWLRQFQNLCNNDSKNAASAEHCTGQPR